MVMFIRVKPYRYREHGTGLVHCVTWNVGHHWEPLCALGEMRTLSSVLRTNDAATCLFCVAEPHA